MRSGRGGCVAALVITQLTGCASLTSPAGPRAGEGTVVVREDLSGRFIALIGPKTQHDPPYLGTPGTNFSCLRSIVDRRTGETAHQLYVAASYSGNHDWSAAHDDGGRMLKFVPISRFKIACDGKNSCSYAEEFAAKLPESELAENRQGFSVRFTDQAGNAQTIKVSANQIAAQLAALVQFRKTAALAPAAVNR